MEIGKEYLEHEVFKKLIGLAQFYDRLSFSISSWMSHGTTTILNFESHIFSSMKGTLESISLILKDGKINDAYALLRKYNDSLIISAYVHAYLQEHHSIENLVVKEINDWLANKMDLTPNRVMVPYIEKYPKLVSVNWILSTDDRYKKIRERCNDHMRYNSFYN